MLNGYKIIDADSHVYEPPSMWEKYLEHEFKEYAPAPDMTIKGEKITEKVSELVLKEGQKQILKSHPISALSGFDPPSHVQAMKKMGIDICFIYPTYASWLLAIDSMSPDVAGAFARAYNNWLRDFCSYQPEILKGVGAISLHQPEAMVSELLRIAEFGWKTVYLRPNPVKGRMLSDPAYEDFWAKCEELGIGIGIHEGSHSLLPTTGADRFNSRFALHSCSHPMEQMMALLALIEGGVLERYPNLKIAFLESGCGWAIYWLWRLDEEYDSLYWEVKDTVKMKPSEYFRRQCFIEIDSSEPYLDKAIELIGKDRLFFGSDYPHMDHKPNVVTQAANLDQQLSPSIVKKILWDNSAYYYGLECKA